MQKISPFLWFDTQAEEAVKFYTSIFKNTKTGTIARYDEAGSKVSGRPAGSVMTVDFQLCGQQFTALNGGPIFQFTPAISFFVSCETAEETDALWKKLSDGGTVLMEYQAYPWSEKYGWLQDRFGVSWQIMLGKTKQKIAPAFLFTQDKYGKAEEAITFWTSLFPDSKISAMQKRKEDMGTEKKGTPEYAAFTLCGQEFNAMESNEDHKFTFSLATSFVVNVETQEELDNYWNALSAVKEAEQCGWLQDKYGVSWQIVPTILGKLMGSKDKEKAGRAMKAMLEMKKLDIAALQKAYDGK